MIRLSSTPIRLLSLTLPFILLFASPVFSLVWNRAPAPPPTNAWMRIISVPMNAPAFFSQSLKAANVNDTSDLIDIGLESPVFAVESTGCDIQSANQNTPTLILSLGGWNGGSTDLQNIQMLPWPLSLTRTGQQRWVDAPLLGKQPMPRDTFGFVAPTDMNSNMIGRAFVFGGAITVNSVGFNYLASLWTLNLETTEWIGLGPSKLVNFNTSNDFDYDCAGKPYYGQDVGSSLPPTSYEPTIDACYWSRIEMSQTDEFGCPWPQPRQGMVIHVVDDTLFMMFGLLQSSDVISDVWRLKLDDYLQMAIEQQSTSTDGTYVYNDDQLKYLQNASDPTINPERLCPVKWELLTRPDGGTASLKNQPLTAPFPALRWAAVSTVSGSNIIISGGSNAYLTSAIFDDIWIFDTILLEWTQILPIPLPDGFSPTNQQHQIYTIRMESIDWYVDNVTNIACANHSATALIVESSTPSHASFDSSWFYLLPDCSVTVPLSVDSDCSEIPTISTAAPTGWSWHEIPFISGLTQLAYHSHTMLPDQTLFQFGGITRLGVWSPPTTFNFRNRVAGPLPEPFIPTQLQDHAMTIPPSFHLYQAERVDRKLYVMASATAGVRLNQMWSYDFDHFIWRQMDTYYAYTFADGTRSSQVDLLTNDDPTDTRWPAPNSGTTNNGSHIFLYGGGVGYLDSIVDRPCSDELMMYEVVSGIWTNLTLLLRSESVWNDTDSSAFDTGGVLRDGYIYPRGRCDAQLAILPNTTLMVMFGGEVNNTAFIGEFIETDNALWSLDLSTLTWKLLQRTDRTMSQLDDPFVGRPSPRQGHNLLALNSDQFLVTFGRDLTIQPSGYSSATWIFTMSSLSWQLLNGGQTLDESFVGRKGAALTLYQQTRLILFGGVPFVGASLTTMYSMDLTESPPTWTQLDSRNTPTPVDQSLQKLFAIDEDQRILLCGGDPKNVVNQLDMDEYLIGGGLRSTSVPHDWLASLGLSPTAFNYQFPTNLLSPITDPSDPSDVTLVPSFHSFMTVAAALQFTQVNLAAAYPTLTILDHEGGYSTRTTNFMSSIPITSNVTLRGPTKRDGYRLETVLSNQRAILSCPPIPDVYVGCNLLIDWTNANAEQKNGMVHLNDFTFRFGSNPNNGGSLHIRSGAVALSGVWIEESSTWLMGGAISVENSRLNIDSCQFRRNHAALVGGVMYAVNVLLEISDTIFEHNRVLIDQVWNSSPYGHGGVISAIATSLTITSSTFVNNSGLIGGAIAASVFTSWIPHADESILLYPGALTLTETTFQDNTAYYRGGAIYLKDLSADGVALMPYITQCQFIGNHAADVGGAIVLETTQLVVTGSTFLFNQGVFGGGAIYLVGTGTNAPISYLPTFEDTNTDNSTIYDCDHPPPGINPPMATISDSQVDAFCNRAEYGPFIATPPASLRIPPASQVASERYQSNGALVVPKLQLELIDLYQQLVRSDNTTFLSVGPSAALGSGTVLVVNGVGTFDELTFRAPPNSLVQLTFYASIPLPSLSQDIETNVLELTLKSNRDPYSGLKSVTNRTFEHLSSCLSMCSFELQPEPNAHSTHLQLFFNMNQFYHDYDQLTVWMDRGAGLESFAQFIGSELLKTQQPSVSEKEAEHLVQGRLHHSTQFSVTSHGINTHHLNTLATGTLIYNVTLDIPSGHISLSLATGDDKVGYVSGIYSYRYVCPDGLYLDPDWGNCQYLTSSSESERDVIIAFCALSLVLIVVSFLLLYRFRRFPLFRAASVTFSATLLGFLFLLPIGGIFFAIIPTESSDVICHARIWFSTIPITGVLSILFAKALRVVSIARSNSLKQQIIQARHMWIIVGTCFIIQLIFCITFTANDLSESVLNSISVNHAPRLIRDCSIEPGFTIWFGIQLGYIAVLSIGAAYLSFMARGVSSRYNESSHVANALFMVMILGVILVPVGILVQEQPNAIVIIQGGGAAFIAIMWTLVLFGPKFLQVYRSRAEFRRQEAVKMRAKEQGLQTAQAMKGGRVEMGDTQQQQLTVASLGTPQLPTRIEFPAPYANNNLPAIPESPVVKIHLTPTSPLDSQQPSKPSPMNLTTRPNVPYLDGIDLSSQPYDPDEMMGSALPPYTNTVPTNQHPASLYAHESIVTQDVPISEYIMPAEGDEFDASALCHTNAGAAEALTERGKRDQYAVYALNGVAHSQVSNLHSDEIIEQLRTNANGHHHISFSAYPPPSPSDSDPSQLNYSISPFPSNNPQPSKPARQPEVAAVSPTPFLLPTRSPTQPIPPPPTPQTQIQLELAESARFATSRNQTD